MFRPSSLRSKKQKLRQATIERLETRRLMAVDFLAKTDFLIGGGVSGVAAGLVNLSDSNIDVVTTNRSDNSLSIRAGNGSGSFFSTYTVAVGRQPVSLAVANIFTFDQILDAVVANYEDNNVTVLFGSGNIAFSPDTPLNVGTHPTCVIVVDVNGDNQLDIVTSNSGSNNVSVILQRSDGGFQAAQVTYAVGAGASSVAAGNLNGDAFPDLVVTNATDGTVSILLNNGDGTFAAQQTLAAGANPAAVTLAFLDGDANLDMVTANPDSGQIGVRLGNGNGTFGARTTYSTGAGATAVVAVDLDGDGKQDLVVANSTANTVSVLVGNGAGAFPTNQTYATGTTPGSVAIADHNGDGKLDIVTGNSGSGDFSLLIQNPPTTAVLDTVAPLRSSGPVNFVVTYTDVPGIDASTLDGSDLLITGPNGFSRNATLISTGLTNGSPLAVTYRISPVGGSFVLADNGTYTVSLVAGQVKDTLGTAAAAATLGTFVVGIDVTRPTAVLAAVPTLQTTGTVSLFVTYTDDLAGINVSTLTDGDLQITGPNGFSRPATRIFDSLANGLTAIAPYSIAPASGRFTPLENGTYTVSLVAGSVADTGGNTVLGAILGTFVVASGTVTTPTFATASGFSMGSKPQAVVAVDLNGDGKVDLITANKVGNNVSVRLGNGDGTFQAVTNFAVGTTPVSVLAADIDNDAKLDLITVNLGSQTLTFLKGLGNGSFAAGVAVAVPVTPFAVAAGFLNNDGFLDLVTANRNDNTVTVLLGSGNGSFQTPVTMPAGSGPFSVAIADVNGDLHADLVVANSVGGNVGLFLGNSNGSGTFLTQQLFAVGISPSSVTVADLNGDGKLDIAVANQSSSNVSVLLANGSGSFLAQQTYAAQAAPASVVAADVDKDGDADLVVANTLGGSVSILLNNGDGSFQNQQTLTVGNEPQSVVVADFNADGKPDVATSNTSPLSNNVSLLLANWTTPSATVTPVTPASRTSGVSTVQIVFSQAVTGFDLADLTLTRGGGANLLTSAQTLTTSDNITFTVGNLTGLTSATGAYLLKLRASGTAILNGQFNPLLLDAQTTFTVDATPPTAALGTVPTLVRDGDVDFVVTYADASGINVATLTQGDLIITAPNGATFSASVVTTGLTNGSPRVVTYRLLRPSNGFTATDNGTYTVSLAAGQVADTFGNFSPAAVLGTFVVSIDGVAPTAVLATVSSLTLPGAVDVVVTYADGSGVTAASLDGDDVIVTGPNGFSRKATLISTGLANGSPLTVTYRIAPVSGAFAVGDNGTYTISLVGGQVSDTAGNLNSTTLLGTFGVAIETSAPTAVLAAVPTLTRAGGVDLSVTYADPSGVAAAMLDGNDLLITGPNGFSRLATLTSTGLTNGSALTATYRITPTSGAFTAVDNGTYTITLVGAQVTDTLGNAVSEMTLGTFVVALVRPTATIVSAETVTDTGTPFSVIVVRYSDDTSVDSASVSRNDLIRVTGPDGRARFAAFADLTSDGTTLTARYRYAPSGAAFAGSERGTYGVDVVGGIAADADGNTVGTATPLNFTVSVLDTGPDLTASITTKLPSQIVGGDRTPQQVTVVVSNTGKLPLAKSNVVVALYLSKDGILDPATDRKVATITLRNLTLKTGSAGKVTAKLSFIYPSDLEGKFKLIARVDDAQAVAETKEKNNTAISTGLIALRKPFVDLSGSVKAPTFKRGSTPTATVTGSLRNTGNVTPTEKNKSVKMLTLRLTAIPTGGSATSAISLGDATVSFDSKFKAGRSLPFTLSLKALPKALVAGTYSLIVTVDPRNLLADADPASNTLTTTLRVT